MESCGPAVVLANHYQFGAGRDVANTRVQSRMLLWCKGGSGEVVVDGAVCCMAKDDFIVMPWNHSVLYRPNQQHPFLVGGVHIIPEYGGTRIVFDVAHDASSPLHGLLERRDSSEAGNSRLVCGSFATHRALAHLSEYAVTWFQRGGMTPEESRFLAALFMKELSQTSNHGCCDGPVPARLNALLAHVRGNLCEDLSLERLATLASCSVSTVNRLFRMHLGVPPAQWVLRTKMEAAAQLLSTTDLPVGQVALRVGVGDPYHFSKVFKQMQGLPPTAYRRRASLLATV